MFYNLGKGFAYYLNNKKEFKDGASKCKYCAVTISFDEDCMYIWHSKISVPYILQLSKINSFINLVYVIDKLKDKNWMSDDDLDEVVDKISLYLQIKKEERE